MSRPITVGGLDPQLHRNRIFRIVLFDLYSSEEKQVREAIYKITDAFGGRKLAPVVYTMVRELAVNALKAVYKKIFFEHVIEELGIPDVTYESWLELFKAEIDAHRAENFSRMARDKQIGISIYLKFNENTLAVKIVNPGQPTDLEYARMQSSIAMCKGMESMRALMEAKEDDVDSNSEGAGMGIPMCIMTLRSLHIPPENFAIRIQQDRTSATLELPWQNLLPPPAKKDP